MSDLPDNPAQLLAHQRWLMKTRVMAAVLPVVALAYTVWARTPALRRGCSENLSIASVALWLASPPYVISLLYLLGKSAPRRKKGLAWAVVAGSFWGTISLLIVLPEVFGGSAREAGLPLLSAVIQITLVTCAMKTYYSGCREPGDAAILFKRVPLFACYLIVFGSIFTALPDFYATTRASRAASAAGALRKINSAQANYARTYPQGFSPKLSALGSPPAGAAPSASGAGLIESDLAGGARSEYTFQYSPGAPDASGKVIAYTLTAAPIEPQCTRWKRFFTDQSGTIHETSEDRAATASDPAL